MNGIEGKRRFWLISPSENAKFWDEFQNLGIISIGWDYLGHLKKYNSHEAIRDQIIAHEGGDSKRDNDSRACFEFAHTISKGDIVIAKKGSSFYLGYGIVKGDYHYDENRAEYRHTRSVNWKKIGQWMDDNAQIVRKTLTDITKYPLYVKKLIRLVEIDEVSRKEMDNLNNEFEIYAPLIKNYKESIKSKGNNEEMYKWEALNHFQLHFNLDAENFGESLKEAISKQYNLLYQRAVMFLKWCAGVYPEELREAFRVLLNEERPLPDRFKDYESRCEQLVEDLKRKEGRDNIGHFQDERTKAFILAMYYPQRYFIYKNEIYKYLIKLLGEPSEKAGRKYFHYRLIMGSLHEILVRDKELLQLHRGTLTDKAYQGDSTRLLTQDLIYQNMQSKNAPVAPPSPHEISENPNALMEIKYPLNQILYGPPGTGKTYSTIFRAVAIIEKKKIIEVKKEDAKDIKRRFDQYKNSGRIAMVTFHQSFSYEDFVEGIKPVMNREDDEPSEVGYQVEDGIFKIMAESAKTLKSLSTKNADSDKPDLTIDDDTLQQAEFYKMSLGNTLSPEDDDIYQYCLENKCVALGWGGNIDFSDIENEQQLKQLLKENEIGSDKGYGYTLTAIKCLKFWMKKGDIIFISNGNKKLRAIAQISGGYFFDEKTPIAYSQFRKVK